MTALSVAASKALMRAYGNHGTTAGITPSVARELATAGYTTTEIVDEKGATIRLTIDGKVLASHHNRATVSVWRQRAEASRGRMAARGVMTHRQREAQK